MATVIFDKPKTETKRSLLEQIKRFTGIVAVQMDKRQSHEVMLEGLRGFHFANPFDQVASLLSPQL